MVVPQEDLAGSCFVFLKTWLENAGIIEQSHYGTGQLCAAYGFRFLHIFISVLSAAILFAQFYIFVSTKTSS